MNVWQVRDNCSPLLANADEYYDKYQVDSKLEKKADKTEVEEELDQKADKSDTYTKQEVDDALVLKADKSDTYTKQEVDSALVLKADKSDTYTKQEVDDALDLKATKQEVVSLFGYASYDSVTNRINFKHSESDSDVLGSIDASPFLVDGFLDSVVIETINGVKYLVFTWNSDSGKQTSTNIPLSDIFEPSNYYDKDELDALFDGKQDVLVSGTNIKTINNESILGNGNISIVTDVDNALDGESENPVQNKVVKQAIDEKLAISDFNAYSASTDTRINNNELATSEAINDLNSRIINNELATSEAINDLNSRIVNIVDNTYQKSETSGATEIAAALNTKQDTLVSGTNIKTINNESILGEGNITIEGGGKAVSGGTNISITTGETADTINCTLPITKNSYNNGVTLGWNGDNSKDYFAVAEGYNSIASGSSSHAEGYATTANTQGSHSEGYKTIAGWNVVGYDQEFCHAEGCQTTAFTYFSHAEGYQNRVQGQASHAEGANNEIFNPFDVYHKSTLVGSHAEGKNNKTYNEAEHASGKFNNSVSASTTFGDSGNTLFSVGNGTADDARHNAFEIRQNGDIYCSDGTNDVKLQDTITATAANTTALGGLKLVKLTKSEYDSLATKDNSTLYVVTDS